MINPVGRFWVWRELFTKPIWLNSTLEQQVILMTLIAMANFKPNEWEFEGEKYKLEAGQFITSAKSISEATGGTVTRQNIRSALKRFEKLEFLTTKSTNRSTLVTLVNWESYQINTKEVTNKVTLAQPTGNQRVTTIEEGNKEKKVIKEDIYSPIINYLNKNADKNYKAIGKKTQSLIDARIKEGFTLDNFYKVIDTKTREWVNTEHDKYLRPETLFGTKFESYLNQKEVKNGKSTRNGGKNEEEDEDRWGLKDIVKRA
jgi:uncharacterized phage protein (TIGR02220 family)